MDAVLYFHFYDPKDMFTPTRTLAFYAAHITTPWDELNRMMRHSEGDIEAQYGEHRRHAVPRIGINLIGYSSSEISAEQHNHVMHAWRTAFLRDFVGCAVSDVYDVTTVSGNAKIFEHTKDLYEQQQAQQLSDTLTAHITTSASPTAAKKI